MTFSKVEMPLTPRAGAGVSEDLAGARLVSVVGAKPDGSGKG